MRDITTRKDIEKLMQRFYDKALTDEVIGLYFTEVMQLSLKKHLPIITDFWENILLDAHYYGRDPMEAHTNLNALHAFETKHFERWLNLFYATIDENFAGEKAEKAKQRAHSIGTVMQMKFIHKHG